MPAQDAAAAQQGQREESSGGSPMTRLLIGCLGYFGIQFAMNHFFASPKQTSTMVKNAAGEMVNVPTNMDDIPPYALRPKDLDEGAKYHQIPHKIAPIWPMDSYVDIIVTLSDSFVRKPLSETPDQYVVFQEKHFKIGNYSDKRTIETTFDVPERVQNNETLWGHFYIGLEGSTLDPLDPSFDPATAHHFIYPMTQYVPKKKVAKTRNLLEGKDDDNEPEEEEDQSSGPIIANYYHPNASFSFIPDSGVMEFQRTHPAVRQFLRLESTGARDGSGQNTWYYPILFVNTFWQLKSHMTLLNDTVKTLPLRIDLNNLSQWKFQTMAAIELSSQQTARAAAFGQSMPGGGDGSEIELVKEIFMDSNPILLGVTAVVSVLHIILETLAFGSDIAHYRKKKDNVGISVRTILVNAFMQAVIFLYLVDNSQNTSWIILGSQGVGILIELWKITTVVNVRLRPAEPGSWLPYQIIFEDKHKLSETEEKTKEYDEIAFKYMYIAGIPLLIGYAIYSLVYDSHKSWYSYTITTLVGSVYAYGFLMMVPSLYINYRLKSVAHMPAKAMMYKFLNTFIDDLFAFTIKMPFLHRLATFRDDVIFFIYIYQRWVYRVDYTRVNEFGQGGEDDEPEVKDKKDAPVREEAKEKDEEGKTGAKTSGKDTGGAKKRK